MAFELTAEQETQLLQARDVWLAVGLASGETDRAKAEASIGRLLDIQEIKGDRFFFWADSPRAAEACKIGLKGETFKEKAPGYLSQGMMGQMEAYWVGHYATIRDMGLAEFEQKDLEMLAAWEEVTRSVFWFWSYEDDGRVITVCSERPEVIEMEDVQGGDGVKRLHNENGPAVKFKDGFSVYAWHGVRVPASLIEEGWDAATILRERNQEVRRAAIEKTGWDAFITGAGLTLVSGPVDDPGNPGQTLSLYDAPDGLYDERARVLLCTNGTIERDGTRRRFGLTVPARHTDPVAAAAELYGWPTEQYKGLLRRT